MSQILYPGEYFIELEFDRPLDPAVLHRALTAMGFGVVVFDQSLPAVQVGALAPVIGTTARSISPATKTAVLTTAAVKAVAMPTVSVAPAPAKAAPMTIVSTVTQNLPSSALKIVAAPVVTAPKAASNQPTVQPVQSRYATTATQATVKLADGGMPSALKPSTPVTPIQKGVAALAQDYAAFATINTKPGLAMPGDSPMNAGPAKSPPGTFPGDVPPGAAAPPPLAPTPSDGGGNVPSDGGAGGGGGGGGATAPADGDGGGETPPAEPEFDPPYDPAQNQPAPDPEPETSPPQAPATPAPQTPVATNSSLNMLLTGPAGAEVVPTPEVLNDLWKKWKEWGSPFASGPPTATSTSGIHDDDPLRFRVLARLDRPIALDDRPGMRWLFVKALSFPFLSDLTYQSNPHTLHQGALYELRFLSRAKSNPTRDSVKQSLVEMGFRPVKLLAFKRNMKLPRRPASLTLWYGMAIWDRADSVIVNDDPFFFETVKEIRP